MIDHRDNPKLHRLHVRWAMEELQVVNRAIEELYSFTRISATIMAGALAISKRERILEDEAFREASWRLDIDEPLPDESVYEDKEQDSE